MITFKHGLKINLPDILATQALASAIAKILAAGLSVYLYGDLGAGKTTLARGIIASLGYIGAIKSPTYTLVETYNLENLIIYHFDLYRVADPSELEYIGIRDYTNSDAVCIFEWPEKGQGFIPKSDIEICLELNGLTRDCTIRANTETGIAALQKLTIGKE